MPEDKDLEKLLKDMGNTLKLVPTGLPAPWEDRRIEFIRNFNKVLGILVEHDLLKAKPPWCIGDIPFFPPPSDLK